MMRWIVASSIKLRFIVVAMAAGMMLYGVTQLRNTPLDVFPEFAPPQVEIQTISLGLSSTDVESLVTVPLEEALNGVPGLETIRSRSVADLSSIQLLFKPGTDLLEARQLVSERVRIVTPTLADLGGSSGDDAAGVGHPPGDAHRDLLRLRVADRDVDHRLLEDPRSPAPRPRRGQRGDLGRAAAAAARPGRSRRSSGNST